MTPFVWILLAGLIVIAAAFPVLLVAIARHLGKRSDGRKDRP